MLIRVAVFLLFVVIFVAIGLVAMAASRFQLQSAISEAPTCVPDDETREKVRAIMEAASEEALNDHLVRLYESWMKDETGQPQRAITGATRGIKAFIGGRNHARKWNPPLCP